MYSVAGKTTATAATANHVIAAIWNPHATQRIKVTRLSLVAVGAPGASNGVRLVRIITRGTPGSTVTPDITNDLRAAVAPVSGALLDLGAYTVQPSMAAQKDMGPGWTLAAVAASGLIWPTSTEIPPGAGLAIVQVTAVATPICAVSAEWLEDWA